jgi:hypothetical protein
MARVNRDVPALYRRLAESGYDRTMRRSILHAWVKGVRFHLDRLEVKGVE